MAEPLKNFYGPEIPARISTMIAAASPHFPQRMFLADATDGLETLDLLPRAWHITRALHKYLPSEFPAAARTLKASLGPPLEKTEGMGMAPFLYLPYVFYVAEYGLDYVDTSLDLQYELTKRFSAEFSIRPFIERYPKQVMPRLREWTGDSNVHVRRLVSEGTRPRLPWAPRLRSFQKDPRPVLELLERLKDDPEMYVRRSVANNLNDIGKDHPELLFEVCRRWSVDAPEDRQWLIRHALRSAIKRGESGALQVVGYGERPKVRLDKVKITPRRAAPGESVQVSFELVSTAARKQSLLVDYQVHFVKADGGTSAKVFKLKTIELPARGTVALSSRISLRQMTTRKHYPGKHDVDVIVNGVPYPAGSFVVR